jgi:hypothetical protein
MAQTNNERLNWQGPLSNQFANCKQLVRTMSKSQSCEDLCLHKKASQWKKASLSLHIQSLKPS